MIPLLGRVVLTVFLCLVGAAVAMDALLRAAVRDARRSDAALRLERDLRRGARDLARLPPDQRPAAVRALARSLGVSLSLAPRAPGAGGLAPPPPHGAAPPPAGPPPGDLRPPPDDPGGGPLPQPPPGLVVVPIDNAMAVHGLAAPPPPGALPPLVLIGALMLLVALSTGLVVALPLRRRLRAIERAVHALAEGNFRVRAEVPRGDALAAVASALNHTAERLDRLFREREEMLQAVSHELGTPLSRMRFHLEALGREASPATAARLRALDEEIRELDELTTELVAWAEADTAGLAQAPFDPAPALDAMLELERETTPRPLTCELLVEAPVTVRAERRLFERAVENLVRNAFRYARTTVRVRVRRDSALVAVSVCDDGPGVPESEREHVLLPFVRLDRARSRGNGGVGLGLAIARRIVERHGGRIAVERSPEGGASFTTWWPAADARC